MTDTSPDQSAAVRELNELFEQGGERGLWEKNKADFGRKIGYERRKISALMHGNQSDDEVQSAVEVARRVVKSGEVIESTTPGETSMEGAETAKTEFDTHYEQGRSAGLWSNVQSCSEALGINRSTITKYRNTAPDTLCATPKGKTTYDRTMRKIKSFVRRRKNSQQNEARKQPLSDSATPEAEQAGSPSSDLAALISHPAIARIDDLEQRLPELLQAAVAQLDNKTPATPEGIIPSQWAEQVLSGHLEIVDQKIGNTRFVVTQETLRKLLAKYSKDQLSDTKGYADVLANGAAELRRRLSNVPQLAEERDRANAAQALVSDLSRVIREFVALAITIEEMRECDVDKGLTRAARHFDSLSDIFS